MISESSKAVSAQNTTVPLSAFNRFKVCRTRSQKSHCLILRVILFRTFCISNTNREDGRCLVYPLRHRPPASEGFLFLLKHFVVFVVRRRGRNPGCFPLRLMNSIRSRSLGWGAQITREWKFEDWFECTPLKNESPPKVLRFQFFEVYSAAPEEKTVFEIVPPERNGVCLMCFSRASRVCRAIVNQEL